MVVVTFSSFISFGFVRCVLFIYVCAFTECIFKNYFKYIHETKFDVQLDFTPHVLKR